MIDISLFSNHSPSEWFSVDKKTPREYSRGVLNQLIILFSAAL